jgi:hypothetical protein
MHHKNKMKKEGTRGRKKQEHHRIRGSGKDFETRNKKPEKTRTKNKEPRRKEEYQSQGCPQLQFPL